MKSVRSVGIGVLTLFVNSVPVTPIFQPHALDLYLAGQHDAAVSQLAKGSRAERAARDLVDDADEWIAKAGTPDAIERRRLAAAALALEFAVARMEDEWYAIRPIIEWACTELRKGPPSDGELAWQRASLAAIQGARDLQFARRPPITAKGEDVPFAVDHVAHAAERFPTDPVIRFAQGFFAEASVPVEGRARQFDVDTAATSAARAIEAYTAAAADPALAAEAALAIGYINLRMKRLDQVMPALSKAAEGGDDFVRYLAHLLRGRAIEQLGGKDEAAAAYRAALAVVPRAQSASMALAALLHVGDQTDQAVAVMSESFAARPAVDPWREYGFGQFRHWARYRDAMRKAVE